MIVTIGGASNQGNAKIQGDYFGSFEDQFLAVSDGENTCTHPEVASKTAVSQAVWAYDVVRRRNFSWAHKDILFKRIFRSTNMHLYHKRADGFTDGLIATLACVYFHEKFIWYGALGDTQVFLMKGGSLFLLNEEEKPPESSVSKLGIQRLGAIPVIGREYWEIGDSIIVATDDVVRFLRIDRFETIVKQCTIKDATVDELSHAVIEQAIRNGATNNCTVVIARRTDTVV